MSIEFEAKQLGYYHCGKPLFTNIDLTFVAGDIICIIGQNGAGKSTLLRICAGILPPHTGHVALNHMNLSLLPPAERAFKIGWLPQSLSQIEDYYVSDFLKIRPFFTKAIPIHTLENHTDNDSFLKHFRVKDLQNRRISTLSGGEWKRVQLCRLWQQEAKLFLLDEPETDLDIKFKHQLLQACFEHTALRKGIILFTTHDLHFARQVANRVCVLHDGLKVWDSPAEEFWQSQALAKIFGNIAEFF